ncbi:hypothetical protein MSPP1_001884 [Malassezia sp. CBS 17886]|nr:hypothetical protein MSPP1_001884 [Malassezia sp. CBS 17886]
MSGLRRLPSANMPRGTTARCSSTSRARVWISEIMLQQTRVETVRSYWERWMERWPTIEALAAATHDDVLAAWRGLGYYSRATRIHQAAQHIVAHPDYDGLLPDSVDALQREVAGVGRYTAGAISSIVFGHAAPILDGNVARVLCRQTGLYADPKAKRTTDILWEMARLLCENAARLHGSVHGGDGRQQWAAINGGDALGEAPSHGGDASAHPAVPGSRAPKSCLTRFPSPAAASPAAASPAAASPAAASPAADSLTAESPAAPPPLVPSAIPGAWNQGLMELGSTLCTPTTPQCGICPVQETCLAYAEGVASSERPQPPSSRSMGCDVEDLCQICNPLPEEPAQDDAARETHAGMGKRGVPTKKKAAARPKMKQATLFGAAPPKTEKETAAASAPQYASKFPKRAAKGQVRVETRAVCIVQTRPSRAAESARYLVHQRPEQGLLASLWEFPTMALPDTQEAPTDGEVHEAARTFVARLRTPLEHGEGGVVTDSTLTRLGRVKHVFTHLVWDMHVFLAEALVGEAPHGRAAHSLAQPRNARWLTAREVAASTMGTGTRRCWELAAAA